MIIDLLAELPLTARALVRRRGFTAVVVLAGTLLGLAAALVASRWLASLLYGVGTTDPLTFAAAPALLLALAAAAVALPARRATLVDPATTLRPE